jgi:hypothetical protein
MSAALMPAPGRLEARQGPLAVMQASWRDPDDRTPTAARTAREIAGYRAYCPLRWMLRRHGAASAVTERHVYAADRLRFTFDVAGLGMSGVRELLPVTALVYGPRDGPGRAALWQTRALREFRRAMACEPLEDRPLIGAVVLRNHSVAAWCAEQGRAGVKPQPKTEMRRLVVCLDRLEAHYASEIDDDLACGRLLAAV